jgi:hypothetical protein
MKKDGAWRKQTSRGLLAVCLLFTLKIEAFFSFMTSINFYHNIHSITSHKTIGAG